MDMEVGHFLMRIEPVVGEQAVSGGDKPCRPRDFADC
ncbi:MAG: hypothetical protein JWL66_1393, partial [Sphingomonadales bacterium]|nr:hypothetical protein [Sphingomonadales bacterium]